MSGRKKPPEQVLMKCGHVSNAWRKMKDGTLLPVCILCDCYERSYGPPPDLRLRKARCVHYGMRVGRKNETWFPQMMYNERCGSITQSSFELPFFEYRPDEKYDKFYCGCHSWD